MNLYPPYLYVFMRTQPKSSLLRIHSNLYLLYHGIHICIYAQKYYKVQDAPFTLCPKTTTKV